MFAGFRSTELLMKTTSVKSKQILALDLDDCGNKVEDEEERGGQVHDLHLGDHHVHRDLKYGCRGSSP